MASVIQVIETEVLRGKGVPDSPVRGVRQFWSLDGELLMECDEWRERELKAIAVDKVAIDRDRPRHEFFDRMVRLVLEQP